MIILKTVFISHFMGNVRVIPSGFPPREFFGRHKPHIQQAKPNKGSIETAGIRG
jgi:hypothetical protein